MPTSNLSNLPSNLSDRELLLVTLQQLAQLKTSVEESHHDMREQLARGNVRFEQIALTHSNLDARIERMIQPVTRAGVEAQRAMELARQSRDAVREIKEDLYGNKEAGTDGIATDVRRLKTTMDEYTYYFKVVGAIFVLIQILIVPLFMKLVARYFGL